MLYIEYLVAFIFSIALFINAALFLPQIIRLIKLKKEAAQGLSPLTFGGFCLIQLSTIAYGLIHSDMILVVGNLLSFLTCGTVTILILIYK